MLKQVRKKYILAVIIYEIIALIGISFFILGWNHKGGFLRPEFVSSLGYLFDFVVFLLSGIIGFVLLFSVQPKVVAINIILIGLTFQGASSIYRVYIFFMLVSLLWVMLLSFSEALKQQEKG